MLIGRRRPARVRAVRSRVLVDDVNRAATSAAARRRARARAAARGYAARAAAAVVGGEPSV
jgi:hypothetical protein